MLPRPVAPSFLLVAVLNAGCVTQSVTVAGPGSTPTVGAAGPMVVGAPTVPAAPAGRATTVIAGRVSAPPGMVAAGGGNIVGNAGGNMVAAGGGNMVAAGGLNFGLLATPEDPLANAWIRLADSAGQIFPAFAAVRADAQGRFEIPGVPADLTFVVQSAITTAAGKAAELRTIVRPTVLGATAEVSAASTCVTAAVLEGQGAVLGDVDPARFKRAVDATRAGLADRPWPDLADPAAILATMGDLAEEVAELREALDAVRADLRRLQGDVAQIRAELDALKRDRAGASAAPAASPPPPAPAATSPSPATTPPPASTAPAAAGREVTAGELSFLRPAAFVPGDVGITFHASVEVVDGAVAGGEIERGGLRFGVLRVKDPGEAFWGGPPPASLVGNAVVRQVFRPAFGDLGPTEEAMTDYLSGVAGSMVRFSVADQAGAERRLIAIESYVAKTKVHYLAYLVSSRDRLKTGEDARIVLGETLSSFAIRGTKLYP